MQKGNFDESELRDFEKLETEAKPDGDTYAPNVFFKDNRQAPTVVIRQVDEKKLEAQRRQKEELMKLAEQFVEVDENPVDDRKTKSIEIVASPELSGSTTSTYVRKDTPASLARLKEIKDHKNNKLKPGKFIPRRMQAQPPKPPQQPAAIEALEERKRGTDDEEDEDDELMKPAPKKVKFDMMPPIDPDSIRRYEEELPGADRAVRQQVEAQGQMRDSAFPEPVLQPEAPKVPKLKEVKEQAEQLRLQAFLNNVNMKSELYLQQKKLRDIALASIQKSFESGENVLETMATYEDLLDFLFVHMPKRNDINVMAPNTFENPRGDESPNQNPFMEAFTPTQSLGSMFQGSRTNYPMFTRNNH